jgi:hypothetical protein
LPSAWSIVSTACAISNCRSANGHRSKLAAGLVFALIFISLGTFRILRLDPGWVANYGITNSRFGVKGRAPN